MATQKYNESYNIITIPCNNYYNPIHLYDVTTQYYVPTQ